MSHLELCSNNLDEYQWKNSFYSKVYFINQNHDFSLNWMTSLQPFLLLTFDHSPRPRFIITHGAHCPGKSLKRPGFSKLSWIVLYFRKNTLTCPWLSWIFFHLLSVSTFQCTVLIWYDLMMIIIVMVNDGNFFNTWSPNNLCIVQSLRLRMFYWI